MLGAVKARRTRDVYARYVWMDELGVSLIPGTDAGVPGAVCDDFTGMLELYQWLGYQPARVLEMATSDAAAALGLAAVTGRIAPGMSADLVVVDGDPARSLAALRAVRHVVARGRTTVIPSPTGG